MADDARTVDDSADQCFDVAVGFDVAVVGAGPAGLAAAVAAADCGLSVALIDAADQPGGQFWRHPDERWPTTDEGRGRHLWGRFTDLRRRLYQERVGRGRIVPVFSRQVWFLEPGKLWEQGEQGKPHRLHLTATVGATAGPSVVSARALILCPGGYDRHLPVPGWDLPGVMAAGGVQALLEAHRSVAGTTAIVAGTGPFLLPVAAGLADAGARVIAVCESADVIRGWARRPIAAASAPAKALEGVQYAYAFARHRIPYRTRTVVTAIDGDERVRKVRLGRLDRNSRPIPGSSQTLDADLVAFGWGFTPSMELIVAAGADTRIDVDGSLVAVVDDAQRSTAARVYVAGEATGVGGGALALAEGELAGLTAAADAGVTAAAEVGMRTPYPHPVIAPRRVRALRRRIVRGRRFAAAMHRAHPVPAHWQDRLLPSTVICRCEEVTHRDLCSARDDLGADDARIAKLVARPGMGWCQGRICGYAVAAITAPSGVPGIADLLPIAKRTIATPITLGELAGEDTRHTNGRGIG